MKKAFRTLVAAALIGRLAFMPAEAQASQGSLVMQNTGTLSGLTLVNAISTALDALVTCNSGSSAPANGTGSAARPGQCWDDTSASWIRKAYDGTSWLPQGFIDSSNHVWVPPVGGGTIVSLSSATTTDLGSVPQSTVSITGTTTITGFGSSAVVGTRHTMIFGGILSLTYNATSMILPGAASITTAAGDVAEAIYLGSSNWRVVNYQRADGTSLVQPAVPVGTVLWGDWSAPPAKYVLAYGQALSRATYPDYLAAVTLAQNGTRTSGSPTLTSVSDTSRFGAGMPIEGTGIPAGTTILSVTSSTITMSQNASSGAPTVGTVTVFLTGYGSGGDSSTVGVKNCQGVTMAGRGNMSGTDRALLTSSYFGASGTAINSFGGAQNHTIGQTHLPNYTLSNTLDVGGSMTGTFTKSGNPVTMYAPDTLNGAEAASPTVNNYIRAPNGDTLGITFDISGLTVTGGVTLNGGANSFPTVQPTVITDCVVRVQL